MGHTEQAHQSQDFISVVLFRHFVLQNALDSLQIFSQDNRLLQAVAVLVVKLFHLIVDVERQVDMVGQNVLALFNVHILQL